MTITIMLIIIINIIESIITTTNYLLLLFNYYHYCSTISRCLLFQKRPPREPGGALEVHVLVRDWVVLGIIVIFGIRDFLYA